MAERTVGPRSVLRRLNRVLTDGQRIGLTYCGVILPVRGYVIIGGP